MRRINMNGLRSRTTTQRGVVKVRKARIVVMLLLIAVAVTIVLIDKKDQHGPEEVTQVATTDFSKPVPPPQIVDNLSPLISHDPVKQEARIHEMKAPQVESQKIEIISPIKDIQVEKAPSLGKEISIASLDEKNLMKTEPSRDKKKMKKKESPEVAQASSSEKKTLKKSSGITPFYHVVASGDTLSTISQKYYGTQRLWQSLLTANHGIIKNAQALKCGQKLEIPPKEEMQKGFKTLMGSNRRVSPKSSYGRHDFEPTSSGKAKLAVKKEKTENGYHEVSKGETLIEIAKHYGVTFLSLYDLNKNIIQNPHRLCEGVKIKIPMASPNR